jgi:hypothetical protein
MPVISWLRLNLQKAQEIKHRRTNNLIKKWANKLNKEFLEEVHMANKYMKKCYGYYPYP